MTRLLSEQIAADNARWDKMSPAERAATRANFQGRGWKLCDHPDCPPWNCRETNPDR